MVFMYTPAYLDLAVPRINEIARNQKRSPLKAEHAAAPFPVGGVPVRNPVSGRPRGVLGREPGRLGQLGGANPRPSSRRVAIARIVRQQASGPRLARTDGFLLAV